MHIKQKPRVPNFSFLQLLPISATNQLPSSASPTKKCVPSTSTTFSPCHLSFLQLMSIQTNITTTQKEPFAKRTFCLYYLFSSHSQINRLFVFNPCHLFLYLLSLSPFLHCCARIMTITKATKKKKISFDKTESLGSKVQPNVYNISPVLIN